MIDENKPEVLEITPSRMGSYLELDEFCNVISCLKCVFLGGEQFSAKVYDDLREYSDAVVYNSYGPTETTITSNNKEVTDINDLTVGLPHTNYVTDVRDIDGKLVPNGVMGELYIGGTGVGKGYYNMPEKTAETIEPDGWLHSGDLATVDEDGYYSIVGRIKDMIIRGGENIYPREIEEYLFTHECVQDVQVGGIPDEKYGELVGAFIIKEEGYEDVTEADIRDFCIGKIARYKVPKYVFFVDEFPLTTSGKIQKYKLGELGLKLLEERRERGEL